MAHNETLIPASPEAVFAVLSDPCEYPGFVVGTKEIRRFDEQWPAVGTEIHWSAGVGRALVKDKTVVVEVEPPTMVHERIYMRPMMTSDVRFELTPEGDATRVRLDEYVVDGPLKRIAPVFDGLIWLRNHEVLRRLRNLVEQGAGAHRQPDPRHS